MKYIIKADLYTRSDDTRNLKYFYRRTEELTTIEQDTPPDPKDYFFDHNLSKLFEVEFYSNGRINAVDVHVFELIDGDIEEIGSFFVDPAMEIIKKDYCTEREAVKYINTGTTLYTSIEEWEKSICECDRKDPETFNELKNGFKELNTVIWNNTEYHIDYVL